MLQLKLFKIRNNTDFIRNTVLFGILLLGIYLLFPKANDSIFVIAIIAFVLYSLITEKNKKAAGLIQLDIHHINILTDQQTITLRLAEMNSLELMYSGYKGKRIFGDFVPNFNKFSGTDNYIKITMDHHSYEYQLLFENETQQNNFMALVESWDKNGYDVSGIRINR